MQAMIKSLEATLLTMCQLKGNDRDAMYTAMTGHNINIDDLLNFKDYLVKTTKEVQP